MNKIAELLIERIASGLKRKSITTCSKWACSYRMMGRPFPGPWTFKYHPWLREMHDSEAEMKVGKKSAQAGYTEWALNTSFFNIDVKGVDTLYVLPAQNPDASDFSAARFDPALEMSPHLTKLFSDVKNVGHKRAGNTNLYIRGSRSRSGLKSIPTGLIILDEVDEMDQENIPLALERAAGQVEKQVLAISTPTIPQFGIDKLYSETTQEHFFFKCPCCSRYTELTFPDSLVITADNLHDPSIEDSHLICKECKGVLLHETKYEWLAEGKFIANFSDRSAKGYHVNQLYSSTVHPVELAKSYIRSQRDPAEEQEFFNSKLGMAHVVSGAGVNDEDIASSIKGYKTYRDGPSYGLLTMGIDQGRWLHYEIDLWDLAHNVDSVDLNALSRCRVIKAGKCVNFEEIDEIINHYRVNSVVIDAHPERRKAYELAARFPGLIKMCFYGNNITGKQIHVGKDEEPTITVDRTSWLDLSLGRFRSKGDRLELPVDISPEYKSHIKALVRIYEKDKNGNAIGRYVNGSNEDHFAHARNYAEIALVFALNLGVTKDIEEVL